MLSKAKKKKNQMYWHHPLSWMISQNFVSRWIPYDFIKLLWLYYHSENFCNIPSDLRHSLLFCDPLVSCGHFWDYSFTFELSCDSLVFLLYYFLHSFQRKLDINIPISLLHDMGDTTILAASPKHFFCTYE